MDDIPDNHPLRLAFVTSATDHHDLPPTRAEVAVVGRSNVGKSSLLNAVAGQRGLARTSKTPGRTQLLNLFAVDDGDNDLQPSSAGTVVDCPGYGYAKSSRADRNRWQDMVDRYLLDRDGLVMTLVLVDGAVGPTALDVEMLDWLRDSGIPFTVVATKHDKVKSSKRTRRRRDLAAGCGVDERAVVWTSADRNVNVGMLRGLVRAWLT
ncbi:ribosome biogenesis GTP-binding protein YihA/YsxC [Salsipaludibacter albus]|uniref:ribosome biogenesis GTP-binding protein YihA/YsxC n=1 Tax=Salsipaludibacter albus TaxID=2849650 RepID=UPI001EE4636C|nr:ribosome biogenesis GTP-binding protein YihA/YsxC [Salsipaludibacter albus]MBY5163669.1 ribosome biogenesis GTP-binding protein YihA/YsxC [Salsipaludibacter albus]